MITSLVPAIYLVGAFVLFLIVKNVIKDYRATKDEKQKQKLITVYIVVGILSIILFWAVNTSEAKNYLFKWNVEVSAERQQSALDDVINSR